MECIFTKITGNALLIALKNNFRHITAHDCMYIADAISLVLNGDAVYVTKCDNRSDRRHKTLYDVSCLMGGANILEGNCDQKCSVLGYWTSPPVLQTSL